MSLLYQYSIHDLICFPCSLKYLTCTIAYNYAIMICLFSFKIKQLQDKASRAMIKSQQSFDRIRQKYLLYVNQFMMKYFINYLPKLLVFMKWLIVKELRHLKMKCKLINAKQTNNE